MKRILFKCRSLMAMMFSVAFLSQFDAVGQTVCQDCNSTCSSGATAAGDCSFAACEGSSTSTAANGAAALAGGSATGANAFAAGLSAFAHNTEAIAIGRKVTSNATNSVTLGYRLTVGSTATNSIVIGFGLPGTITNNISNSIMLGMNSDVPTVFIGNSGGTSGSYGNVGIGNITDDAESLLHVRDQIRVGYDSEDNGSIIFNNSTNSNTVGFQSGVSTANQLYTLPLAYGSDGDVLTYSTTGNQLSSEDPATPIVDRPLFRWGTNTTTSVMELDINGNLGLGTATPDGRLDVNGTLFAQLTGGGTGSSLLYNSMTGEILEDNSTVHMKEDIQDLQVVKEQVLGLRPVAFKWKEACGGQNDIGLIAEEVEQTLPELAVYGYKRTFIGSDGELLRDSTGVAVVDSSQVEVRGVNYPKLALYLLGVVKQQDSLMQDMDERIDELQQAVQYCCSQEPAYRIGDEEEGYENDAEKTKSLEEYVLLRNDPNPFSDYTDVKYEALDCEGCQLVIVDIQGRVVKRIKVNGSAGVVRIYSSEIGKGLFSYSLIRNGVVIAASKMVSSR